MTGLQCTAPNRKVQNHEIKRQQKLENSNHRRNNNDNRKKWTKRSSDKHHKCIIHQRQTNKAKQNENTATTLQREIEQVMNKLKSSTSNTLISSGDFNAKVGKRKR